MTLKNQTKLLFAKELEEMLKNIPMDKIRIVDLCKRCDTIPQTFYYHFHDKYELVAWIFLYDFSLIYGDKEPEYSIASIKRSLIQMEKRKTFYQQTYTDHSQNSINQYIQRFNIASAKAAVEDFYQTKLTSEQEYAIKYHSYGSMGLFNEWLNNLSSITIEELATFQYQHTPEFLKVAYQNYSFRNSRIFK
ncbi:TetR/AcrR family transcriptional regulator C-terminal domain-containing protein [Companilactobacillus paralimentarius]|uniref:TetR/AcrR family transcriptional regulator C-terminal domain-containing protein n=1 Tax=Companilactobacillus paralimentarius TaxID=83526 RepID=UPI00384D8863